MYTQIDSSIIQFQNKRQHIKVIVQAGGQSTRNALSIPNQFVMVDNKPVMVYVLEAYEKHPQIDEIDVVCLASWEKTVASYAERYGITKLNRIITGGDTIIESVSNAIEAIRSDIIDNDVLILQEATRPLINEGLISKIISSYNQFGDSVFVRPMSEFVQIEGIQKEYKLCDRGTLYSLESPEIYNASRFVDLLTHLDTKSIDDGSCCAVLVKKLGIDIHYCENIANNPKIIRQEDLYYFKALRQVLL